MDKKVTIYDIAREAGVSAATVSYVINNRPDKTISEETRKKILHIVNLYNYKPAAFAKNLRTTPDSKLIALYTGESDSSLFLGEFIYFIKKLGKVFPQEKYGLIISEPPYRRVDKADAIIAYNIDKKSFYEIGNMNYVPLIAVDCIPNDTLFFQVTTDYKKLKAEAIQKLGDRFTYVCLSPADESVRGEIEEAFNDVIYIDKLNDLHTKSIKANVLTTNKVIAEYFDGSDKNVFFSETLIPAKCECVFSCLVQALRRTPFDVHFYRI